MNKLLEIQAELKAPKSQFNSFGKYHYRNCEDILEALKPLLVKHGLTLTISDDIVAVGNRVYVRATASIKGAVVAEDVSVTAYARESEDKKGMDAAQVTGAASSYARKYALNGLFLIDDTKDADSSNDHGKAEETAHKPTYRAEIPSKGPENPATGKHEPFAAAPMAPKQGLSATGKISSISEPNKGGYVAATLEGYDGPSGKPMRFSTKNAELIAILTESYDSGNRVSVDYNDTVDGKYINHNIDNVTVILDTVPF